MAVPYETAHSLAQLSGDVLGAPDLDAALTRVAESATALVPGCDGTSVTLRSRGAAAASTASNAWATALDVAQFEEQEGPCLDCLREGTVMRVRELADDARFPSYGPRAAAMSAHSALSVPLTSDGQTVGALDLYGREPDVFDVDALGLAALIAAHASLALQAATAYFSSRQLAEQLKTALEGRAQIEQAKGILMAERRCTADEAFEVLVELSQRSNRKLRDVARALVEEAVRPAAG